MTGMSREEIKDARGKLVGVIEDKGKEVLALDASGRRKARFDKQQNVTYDAAGNELGKGNQLLKVLGSAPNAPSNAPKPGFTKYGTPLKPKK